MANQMYDWVVNKDKYNRAVKAVTDAGEEATEEAVKAMYISMAGLIIGDESTIESGVVTDEDGEIVEEDGKPIKSKKMGRMGKRK